jgi:hypothetical protein
VRVSASTKVIPLALARALPVYSYYCDSSTSALVPFKAKAQRRRRVQHTHKNLKEKLFHNTGSEADLCMDEALRLHARNQRITHSESPHSSVHSTPTTTSMSGGFVRRVSSRPISIIRSTSVPGKLHEKQQQQQQQQMLKLQGYSDDIGLPIDHSTAPSPLYTGKQSNNSGSDYGIFSAHLSGGSTPGAPLMVGSLPPTWAVDDMPQLRLPPQADTEDSAGLGSLSASYKSTGGYRMSLYASSCPAAVPKWSSGSKHLASRSTAAAAAASVTDASASVSSAGSSGTAAAATAAGLPSLLEEAYDTEDDVSAHSGTPSSLTILSVLESLAGEADRQRRMSSSSGAPAVMRTGVFNPREFCSNTSEAGDASSDVFMMEELQLQHSD